MPIDIASSKKSSPYKQIFLLCFYWLVGTFGFIVLALGFLYLIYGKGVLNLNNLITAETPQYITALKIFQIFSATGMFIFPPIMVAYHQGEALNHAYGFKKLQNKLLLLVMGIMLFSLPAMEFSQILNEKLVLPDSLHQIEQWMRAKEDAASKMTYTLIKARNHWDFILNLVMIALIPGIGEELFFRGGLQSALQKILKNHHITIWLTAALFSAFHFQFFGFLPRLLLGAGFGYLYFYSGSIWYAIIGHFLNNAYAVCIAYYMQLNHLSF